MPERTLVAGVDTSTQSTTVLVVDPATGVVVARGRAPHAVTGVAGARESDPEQWWTALRDALAQTGRAGEIASIAVAGQQHGLVVLDAAGHPLRPARLWNDTTSAPDVAELIADLGGREAWARTVGSVPTTSFTVAKWAQLRREDPVDAAACAAVRLPHDFVTERLCGVAVTDRGDASGTGWWSPATGLYVEDVLDLERMQLDRSLLPTVLRGGDPAGRVRVDMAEELGLGVETLVAAGTGDNMAAAIGMGARVGTPVIGLGTSGTAYCVSEAPSADPSGAVAGFADAGHRFLPLACTLNATLAVDRVAAWLGRDREDVEPAGEVVVLPYLDGERTPAYPLAAASISGLRHATTPGQILQATYDGVAEALLSALDTFALDPDAPLLLVGGGAQGTAWQETVARLSGRPLVLAVEPELVALGAAALARAALDGDGADAAEIARGWPAARLAEPLPPRPRDDARRARIARTRALLHELNADDA